ncbi:MAG: ribosome silencing factor [Opitutales bacterium]|jgi:ribosome-associated protein|nr:ribosome silencing factor [Opitutales bacterium]|tara:strand:+ start:314 stop:694 length:381 start_codon:yes stop_codon:yes gene_type:complete
MPILQSQPKTTPEEILEHVTECCKALDDKKASQLVVLDMRKAFDVTDYFIIATGTSAPHLRALFSEMDAVLSNLGYQIPSKMKDYHTGWVVVDAIDFVIHLFSDEQREFYSIERLWKDCPQIKIKI